MIKTRLKSLRAEMAQRGIDAYIINSADPHLSEYVAPRYKSRKWISGFTGSAGTVVITQAKAGLWTDGRYFIQAATELEGSGIELFKMRMPGVPTYFDWIKENLEVGNCVGFDGKAFSVANVKLMQKTWKTKSIDLKFEEDLLENIWLDRPAIPQTPAIEHELTYCGKSRIEKFMEIRVKLKDDNVDALIVSALDEIAWLFNIRGNDVECSPVTLAFGILQANKAHLFIGAAKLSSELITSLTKDHVKIHPYHEIYTFLEQLQEMKKVQFAANSTNHLLYSSLPEEITKHENNFLISKLKAKKNATEVANLKATLKTDMIALTKFICWLKRNIGTQTITEISATDKLLEFRQQSPLFRENSFTPISAFGANAAMMHYSADEKSNATFQENGFYLIDSGGQYLSGTTDITRTIAFGDLTYEQKRDFTLVLKGVIDLSSAKFLDGTTGANLDILARMPVWKHGIDYKCGTGHGVGFYLNVHEGPQNFSQSLVNIPFEPGMITTVEPGVYLEDQYGIRTENMLLTVEAGETDFGKWLEFETISFCPIDVEAILPELLTREQLDWINNYHAEVYENLALEIDETERAQLQKMTAPLS